jgi:hypothetical protein
MMGVGDGCQILVNYFLWFNFEGLWVEMGGEPNIEG